MAICVIKKSYKITINSHRGLRKKKKGHEGQRTAPRGEIGLCRYSLMHQVKDQ